MLSRPAPQSWCFLTTSLATGTWKRLRADPHTRPTVARYASRCQYPPHHLHGHADMGRRLLPRLPIPSVSHRRPHLPLCASDLAQLERQSDFFCAEAAGACLVTKALRPTAVFVPGDALDARVQRTSLRRPQAPSAHRRHKADITKDSRSVWWNPGPAFWSLGLRCGMLGRHHGHQRPRRPLSHGSRRFGPDCELRAVLRLACRSGQHH
ncbi:hypothetical protein N658DRAFT_70713 [Parathielavia hyrcaniae]|uniref:Uncharacterized protein n=1 Tax=Parathielavia hyrcaniae TaxID=113614 RepID=A0AAN6Q2X8_9PEZI|nr:hypothetical protein N658DRAFT_70713 [Parathielavia hyrcaniae]